MLSFDMKPKISKGNLRIQTQDGHKGNMDEKQRDITVVPIYSQK